VDMRRAGLFEHGAIDPNARVLKLPATRELSLWHFSAYDVSGYSNTNNRYSSLAAQRIDQERRLAVTPKSTSPEPLKRASKRAITALRRLPFPLRMLLLPRLRFIWHYFLRGGVKSGWSGLMTS